MPAALPPAGPDSPTLKKAVCQPAPLDVAPAVDWRERFRTRQRVASEPGWQRPRLAVAQARQASDASTGFPRCDDSDSHSHTGGVWRMAEGSQHPAEIQSDREERFLALSLQRQEPHRTDVRTAQGRPTYRHPLRSPRSERPQRRVPRGNVVSDWVWFGSL